MCERSWVILPFLSDLQNIGLQLLWDAENVQPNEVFIAQKMLDQFIGICKNFLKLGFSEHILFLLFQNMSRYIQHNLYCSIFLTLRLEKTCSIDAIEFTISIAKVGYIISYTIFSNIFKAVSANSCKQTFFFTMSIFISVWIIPTRH